ncbi:PIR protein CIR protein [Plasmodium vinckei brucechwatti]|uniref:PIR protein CIR protein n=1 Tax=Plasmodium vinckei brucechwatti TaxID=119398 RepID=A0A6V7SKD3_PLAVN|nr:PIR protein CIR protein [Plasmodium vinckei brucechwatti]
MDDKACDFLREVDEYFNNGTVNAVKFRKFKQCHSYCPHQNNPKGNECINNYERINAVGSYLHKKISEIDEKYKKKYGVSRHIELFMIWLGGKLFKIENDYKATLEESYKNHLENHMGNYDYWKLLDSNKLYKNATIKKMSDLYGLLNSICKLINEYNKSTTTINRSNLRNSSIQCLNFYRTIYNSVNGCKPYLYLLDNLKMLYENFRAIKMANNNFKRRDKEFLSTQIKPITTFGGENKYLLSLFANLSFDDEECREVKSNDEKIGKTIESKNLQSKTKGPVLPKKKPTATQGRVSGNLPPANSPVPKPAPPKKVDPPKKAEPPPVSSTPKTRQPQLPSPTSPQTPQKPETSHQSGTKDSGGTKGSKGGEANALGGGISQPVNSEGKSKDDAQKSPDQVDNSSPGSKAGNQGSPGRQTKDSRNPAPAPSGANTSQPPASGTPGASTTTSKDTQNDVSNPQDSNSKQGVPGGAGGEGSGAGGGGSGTGGGDSGTGGGGSGTGDGGSGANGLGDQRKLSGGSSAPALSTPGGSFDWGSSFLQFLLNGTDNLNKASQFIQKNRQKVKEAADKISNVYKNTMDSLKGTYSASSSYISEFINNVTSQLNQVGSPSKSGGSQPESGSPSGGGNSSNQSPLPQSPSTTDQKNIPLPSPNPASNPTSTSPKDPLSISSQQKQPPSQSQPIIHQTPQADLSNDKTTGKINVQLVKSLGSDLNLKKPWNILPTTWNGSVDCKPKINFINTTLVCCTPEQCSLTGIPVTLVLIPIILLISYKYLSFGSSKKSEKKNMKRVIKLVDGNRTQIIINSHDRNKDLKPVINSVGRKKNPLLNIYKLIRADPMPFINLFFLLIFFVYKRKRDIIE